MVLGLIQGDPWKSSLPVLDHSFRSNDKSLAENDAFPKKCVFFLILNDQVVA